MRQLQNVTGWKMGEALEGDRGGGIERDGGMGDRKVIVIIVWYCKVRGISCCVLCQRAALEGV